MRFRILLASVVVVFLLLAIYMSAQRPAVEVSGKNKPSTSPSSAPLKSESDLKAGVPISAEAADPNFDAAVAKEVEEAIRLSSTDPVSAILTLKGVLENKQKPPDTKLSARLQERLEALQPQALATLQEDFNGASAVKDVRGMFITWMAAERISKGAIGSQEALAETRESLLSGVEDVHYIWKISNARGTPIAGNFSEDEGGSRITLTTKPDAHFLRVKARVENISEAADKPYTLWAVEDLKRTFAFVFSSINKDESQGPARWLDESFIFLVSPSLELYACAHVCKGSPLRDGALTITNPDGAGRIITMPHSIKSGAGMEIDVLFIVPKNVTSYRLLIFGAPPIEIG